MIRMDNVIFAIRPGHAAQAQVEDAHRQLAAFGVPVLGGALLTRPGRGVQSTLPVADPVAEPPSRRRTPAQGVEAQDLLVEALLRERSRSDSPADGMGAGVDEGDEVGDDDAETDPGTDPYATLRPVGAGSDLLPVPTDLTGLALVSSLAPSATGDPSEALASLLSETIEHVLRGFSGGSSSQRVDPGIAEVTKYGFVPLVRIKGHKTIGARVLDALNAKIESAERSQLITELVAYFGIEEGGRSNERVVSAINEWVRDHYFTRHLVDTGREPQVWHVASRRRTFEGLVHAARCSKERIDLFRSEILPASDRHAQQEHEGGLQGQAIRIRCGSSKTRSRICAPSTSPGDGCSREPRPTPGSGTRGKGRNCSRRVGTRTTTKACGQTWRRSNAWARSHRTC